MNGLTICAANYLPFAKTLANSFLKFHPESKFYLLLVDGDVPGITIDLGPEITIIKPSDLNLDPEVFMRMAIYYDVTELSTALKPLGLKYLLDTGSEIAIYLDPDIEVFSELVEIPKHLESANIALTPHSLHGFPNDELRPTARDIMASGTFNLGFIAVKNSEQSYEFLTWWNEKLIFDCISDVENNLFTDQRWIDFVPSYYSFSVIREYGYNVAYWNLHEREITKVDSGYYVNSTALRFFHFSGYSPNKPWILSKHVADKPRVVISSNSLLKELAENYGKSAVEHGWDTKSSLAYGYSKLNEQIMLTPRIRKRYRHEVIEATRGKCEFPPLANDSQESVLAWLNKQIPESGRLNVSLFDVWKGQPDLQAAFPLALGKEAKRLVWWAHKYGIGEGKINESTIKIYDTPMQATKSSSELPLSKKLGVNVAGYFKGEFGVGQFGRLVAQAAIASGLPVTTLVNRRTESRQDEEFELTVSKILYPVTIGSINADQFALWLEEIPSEVRAHSKFVGVWAWEIESFPKHMHAAFDYVDEVWAISSFVRDSIQPHTRKPVLVFPCPIISPSISEKLDRSAIGISEQDEFNLFMFDYFSIFRRKNPLDLIEAHILAFPDESGPKLIIKTINGQSHASQQEQLRYAVGTRSDIIIINSYMPREQLHSLLSECQTYISLHRSEGYGLTLAEAMALGKPVIATGYSGNMDFMKPENSILVPFELVPVGDDAFPYPQDSRWAQPDIEYAANAMRELSLDESLRSRIGGQARLDVISEFTMDRAAEFTRVRVEYLHRGSSFRKKARIVKRILQATLPKKYL
jgi:glycosyltransferase involved in cell wall biosynthesis